MAAFTETYNFDAAGLPAAFTTGGDVVWTTTNSDPHAGSRCAISGLITGSQVTWIQRVPPAIGVGGGNVTFWWKVGSEAGFDFHTFYVNGVPVAQISGAVAWTEVSVALSPGVNTLKWEYSKDGSVDTAPDRARLDDVFIESFDELQASAVAVLVDASLDEADVSAVALLADANLDEGDVSAVGVLVDASIDEGDVSAVAVLVDAEHETGDVSAVSLLVDAEYYNFAYVSGVAVLVDARIDTRLDVGDLNADIRAILLGVRAAHARVRSLLESGTASERDLRGLDVALSGYAADIRTARATLDATDIRTALLYPDGADTIRLWAWERQIRQVLVRLDAEIASVLAVVQALVEGTAGRQYAVRSGDTLQSIAQRQLGDWKRWREIADLNGLSAGPLTSGVVLTLPEAR